MKGTSGRSRRTTPIPPMVNPALPLLVSVAIALVAAPFPWVGSGGLPPASAVAPASPVPGRGAPVPETGGPARVVAVVRAEPGPMLGPPPALVAPELRRKGTSSAAVPVAAVPVAAAPAAPVVVPATGFSVLAAPLPALVPVTVPAAPAPPPTVVTPPVTFPPPPMTANVTVDPAGGEWLRNRAAAALDQISYPWRSLGYEIAFHPARPGLRARTLLHERRIEVYARQSDPVRQTAFDVAHEVAHAFDFSWGTWADRERWQQARGLDPTVAWFGCNACADLATPAGDFAESFAVWQVPGGDFRSTLGPPPDEPRRALLAELTGLDA
jgi:hypothetical protein